MCSVISKFILLTLVAADALLTWLLTTERQRHEYQELAGYQRARAVSMNKLLSLSDVNRFGEAGKDLLCIHPYIHCGAISSFLLNEQKPFLHVARMHDLSTWATQPGERF